MADLASATAARQTAVGENTLENKIRAWSRFSEYCRTIGLGDNLFLKDISQTHQTEIIGGAKGNFLDHMMLPWLKAQSQIPSTMWLWSSAKWDAKRNVARLLWRQLRSYKKDNPK